MFHGSCFCNGRNPSSTLPIPCCFTLHYLKGNTTHVRKETKILSKKQNKKKENQKFLAKENQKTKNVQNFTQKKLRKTEKIGKKQIKKIKQKNKKLREFFTCRSNPLVTSCSPDAQNCGEMQVFHLPNQPSRHFGCPKPLRNANFSRCEATFSSLRARRMPKTVVKWWFFYGASCRGRRWYVSYIFAHAAVAKRAFFECTPL